MANLAILQHYLTAGIQVHHPAHGNGILVGLPYCCSHEKPRAEVRYESNDAGLPSPLNDYEYYDLNQVKPVLYSPGDFQRVIDQIPKEELPVAVSWLPGYRIEAIQRMAILVDLLRNLGIALNVPEGSYIRKEVASG
jgi:hypothetical protein